jgi:predicted Rossmann-fold nucleotide-binding protein
MIRPDKIISGGQTGADRAGLDCARMLGITTGGWCPRGRRAEDGMVPPEYPMRETQETDYRIRTQKNIEEADGTIVFIDGSITVESGSALTVRRCVRMGKPHMLLDLSVWSTEDAAKSVRAFVRGQNVRVLNVAGSRASLAPKIWQKVVDVLKRAFTEGA